jgi:hypothetical protein
VTFAKSPGHCDEPYYLVIPSEAVCSRPLDVPVHLMSECELLDYLTPPAVYPFRSPAWPSQLLECTEITKKLMIALDRRTATSRRRDVRKIFFYGRLTMTLGE